MSTMERSIIINAPVGTVFEFARDPGRFWSVAPDVASREVVLTPDGAGSTAHLYTHGLGLHAEGRVEYIEVVAQERIVAKVDLLVEHPTWAFTFEPVDGGTKLTVQGEWHVKLPVVGKAIEGMEAREHEGMVEQWLAALKERLEAPAAA